MANLVPPVDAVPYHTDTLLAFIHDPHLRALAAQSKDLCVRLAGVRDKVLQLRVVGISQTDRENRWPAIYNKDLVPLFRDIAKQYKSLNKTSNHIVTWNGTADARAKESTTFNTAVSYFKNQTKLLIESVTSAAELGLPFHLSDKPKVSAFAASCGKAVAGAIDWTERHKYWIGSAALAFTGITQLLPSAVANPIFNFHFDISALYPFHYPWLAMRHALCKMSDGSDTCSLASNVGGIALALSALYPLGRVLEKPLLDFAAWTDDTVSWLYDNPVYTMMFGAAAGVLPTFTLAAIIAPSLSDFQNQVLTYGPWAGMIGALLAPTGAIEVAKFVCDTVKESWNPPQPDPLEPDDNAPPPPQPDGEMIQFMKRHQLPIIGGPLTMAIFTILGARFPLALIGGGIATGIYAAFEQSPALRRTFGLPD